MLFLFQEGLFSGGLQAELEEIIDMLDTGGRDLPGSVFSVGSILLTFLAALAEPVIPVNLHSRCMDASNNATLCKQVYIYILAGICKQVYASRYMQAGICKQVYIYILAGICKQVYIYYMQAGIYIY